MASHLWTDDLFAEKYRLEGTLGRGGMGMVLAAHHLRLDEPVAIKVLLPDMLAEPRMVDRFLREARAASKIKSEHVVRIMDVDVIASSGAPYIVMERLAGSDMGSICRRSGPIAVDVAVGWLLDACEAIGEAHALGIVHRDLKPANLFLARRPDGTTCVKVLDFGVAKMNVDAPSAKPDVTATGVMLGTPGYMAPEQMISARRVDQRADIWALGAILYRLTAGVPPFHGRSAVEICTGVLNATPLDPPSAVRPDIPPELDAVIMRCLERERDRRFPTVAALAAALRPFARRRPRRAGARAASSVSPTVPMEARTPGPTTTKSFFSATERRLLYWGIGIPAFLLLVFIAVMVIRTPPNAARPEALAGAAPSASADPGILTGAQALRDEIHADLGTKRYARAVNQYEELLDIDPRAAGDSEIRAAIVDGDMLGRSAGVQVYVKVFGLLQNKMGATGIDILYEILTKKWGTPAAQHANSLLARSTVLGRGSQAVQIAYALRVASSSCAATVRLLDRAAAFGDRRAVELLTALLIPTDRKCGPFGLSRCPFPCPGADTDKIKRTIEEIEARTRPTGGTKSP